MYSGSEWVEKVLKINGKPEMSILGKDVADLLGFLFYGIYHIEREVMETDWSNGHHIEVRLKYKGLSTTDYNDLTRLVLLCHHMAIRCSISPMSRTSIKLLFHRRTRGEYGHPTIEEAINKFNETCYLEKV